MQEEERVKLHERVTSLEGSMKTIFGKNKELEDRMDAIENKQDIMHEMNTNIKIIALNQENQSKEIVTIKCDVKDLKEKPGKRWNTLETVIITALVSGAIALVLNKIFGG